VKTYFVYILKCSDGSFYTGVTNNVERRVFEHESGLLEKCYTHTRRPVKLVYATGFAQIEDAIAWEKHVKGWSRKKKIALIMDDFEKIHEVVAEERKRRSSA
jgi:putative endonuclease